MSVAPCKLIVKNFFDGFRASFITATATIKKSKNERETQQFY
jgi:hypothetical protein